MRDTNKLLSKEDMELINEQFGLQLQYSDAEHYRAAQVIWTFWKKNPEEKTPNREPEA